MDESKPTGDVSVQRTAKSRRGFMRAGLVAGLTAAPIVAAFSSSAEAGFAGSVQDIERRRKQIARNFRSIQAHENTHVTFLKTALGSAARPKPTFKGLEQRNVNAFYAVADALENTGVGAYGGAAPYLNSSAYLAAAASIAFVEARHSGYLNDLTGLVLTSAMQNGSGDPAFDKVLTAAQVRSAAGGFIANLNGGPAIDYALTKSNANDIAILNFALALEYLEADFYNINVPKFF